MWSLMSSVGETAVFESVGKAWGTSGVLFGCGARATLISDRKNRVEGLGGPVLAAA